MEQKSIKKNYLYNLVYQVLILILPIVTTPYISRVLGAEKVGIYSFTISIVTYFSLFGTLGVSLYGQREIAYARENKSKRKKTFFEIIFFRFITMSLSIAVYFFVFARNNEYQEYYQILLLYLLAAAFDISWFFQGMEEFKKTVTRNVIVRIISVCCIFLFVKTQEDLSKYLLIYSLADFLGNLSLWLYLPKYFKGVEIKHLNIRRHMIPIVLLFIPQIAIKLYNIIDRTMIGYMIAEKSELGNYEEAYKLINVLFTVVSSLSIVMVPRIASVFASGDKKKLNDYIIKSFRFTFFLAFPMMMGIITISKEFVPIFLGEGYDKVAIIINILAPMLVLCGITNVIGTQYLLPTKRQKEYTLSILGGLIVNIVLNLVAISFYGAIGAAVATTISQLVVACVQIYYVKREISIKRVLKSGKKYGIVSVVMLVFCIGIGMIVPNGIASVIAKVMVGVVVYFFMLIALGDKYVYEIRDMIIRKLKK
ncbi:MAG: flippase [Clostridia bacterium]